MQKAKLPSAFRTYCQNKWFEHRDEILDWTGRPVDYDAAYYFRKHRWMLRKMFLEEFAQQNARAIQKSIKRSLKGGNL
jgi:hypothetical protein